MNLEELVFSKLLLKTGKIIAKSIVAKDVFRLDIAGDFSFRHMIPGQHIRILLYPNQAGKLRDRLRTYSVWNYKEQDGQGVVTFAICAHTDGPGSRWVREVEVGQEVRLSAPFGKFTLEKAFDKHFFIGDITTLAHYYFLRRNLREGQSSEAFIYGHDREHFFSDLDGNIPFRYHAVEEKAEKFIVDQSKIMDLTGTAIYIAGDGKLCVTINNFLTKELKISKKQIRIKPFWMEGKTGLE